MGIEFTKVFDSEPLYGGCGPRSVTCYGEGRMVAIFEEVSDEEGGPYPQRIIRSADNGLTWTEDFVYLSTYNLWFWQSMSPQNGVILVGTEGPDLGGAQGDDAGVARSEDGGETWIPTLPADYFDADNLGDFWDIECFAVGTGGRIVAGGYFDHQDVTYNILKSDDYGATFGSEAYIGDPLAVIEMKDGTSTGDGVLLFVAQQFTGLDLKIYRSPDNGDTWDTLSLTTTAYTLITYPAVGGIRAAGDVVMVAATGRTAGGYVPLLWKSTNGGASWTEISDAVVTSWGGGPSLQRTVSGVICSDATHWILTVSSQAVRMPSAGPILVSEDGGESWSGALVPGLESTPTQVVNLEGRQSGIADDGAILIPVSQTDATDPFHWINHWDIWRGVPSWEATPGPCWEEIPPPPAVPHSIARVPTFHPVGGCPQECGL